MARPLLSVMVVAGLAILSGNVACRSGTSQR
jgi:hypothetical protein